MLLNVHVKQGNLKQENKSLNRGNLVKGLNGKMEKMSTRINTGAKIKIKKNRKRFSEKKRKKTKC